MMPASFTIGVDTRLTLPLLSAIAGVLSARSELERRIEISALRALVEIQELGDRARRELGLCDRFGVQVALKVSV